MNPGTRPDSIRRIPRILPTLVLAVSATFAMAQERVWFSHGPTNVGQINDLAIAGEVSYAATPNGVFRSRDRGTTWQQTSLAAEEIVQIAARPGTPLVLAVGTFGKLFVSRDDGQNWAHHEGLLRVYRAAIDAEHPSTVYAGADGRIWKSTDGALSWSQLPNPPGFILPMNFEVGSGAIYVLDRDNGLLLSVDEGLSWRDVRPSGAPPLVMATGNAPGVVYTVGANGFCRSSDSGTTWTCTSGLSWDAYPWGFTELLELPGGAPGPPRLIASSGAGCYISRDGGETWSPASTIVGSSPPRALASDTSGSLLLAGTDIQILRSEDRGDGWVSSSTGLRAARIDTLAISRNEPSIVWAGGLGSQGEGAGLYRSADGGMSWARATGLSGAGSIGAVASDPEDPSTVYAGSEGFVFRTSDGGQTWSSSPSPGRVKVLSIDPYSPHNVWMGTYSGLHRSDDGAQTWVRSPMTQEVFSILFGDHRPGVIYAGSYADYAVGSYGYPRGVGGSIFASDDGGATFTKGIHIGDTRFGNPILAMATDPFEDGAIYAAIYTQVLRIAGGNTQYGSSSPQGNGFTSLVADPVRPGHVYAATDWGVLRSVDRARTWQPFSAGLGSLYIRALAITPDGRRLHAGTSGGVYEYLLAPECIPAENRLCLVGGRYAVELLAGRRGEPATTPGTARPLADRAGYFSLPFATGDAELPEVIVKVLGHGALGLDGTPIFYASLTTLPFVLTVTDTVTGEQEVYRSQADQPLCGAVDVAFEPEAALAPGPRTEKSAAGDLRLLSGRFSVTLSARHPRTGAVTSGHAVTSADRYGFFTLPGFTSDPTLPEVIVKMLDFRSINGTFLLFHTGLTSADYTLTVSDSVSSAVRHYQSPGDYCGAVASDAFSNSPSTGRADPSGE